MKNRFLMPVVISIAIAVVSAGCGQKVEKQAEQNKNVKVITAATSKIFTEVEYSSKLKPVNEVSIVPKTPGKVVAVNFDVGQQVNKDDVLFTLDSKDIQAQITQQKAGVEVSRINLEKTRGSGLEQQLTSAEQAFEKAQLAYDNAKDTFDKKQKLFDAQAISRNDFTDAENRLKSAATDLDAAKENLSLIKQKSGPQSIQSASAQVQQSEAGVASSIVALENTIIKAPISGVVSLRNVDAGEMASSASPAYTIIDTKEMVAEVSVSDKMLGKVQKNQKISIKINALENKVVEGIVDSISPAADDKTQNYIIKIKINNADNTLKASMFARVMLPAEAKENALTVPKATIKIENGINYVYIVDNGVVKKVSVTTGIFNDKLAEITSNLKEGDLVITEGQIFLNEGEKVNIVK